MAMGGESKAFWWVALAALGAAIAAGCTPAQYSDQADKAAYGTLRAGQKAVLGGGGPFDVTYQPFKPSVQAASTTIQVGSRSITIGGAETVKLSLEECLQIAFRNSRSLQTRKETLYVAALALASARRDWDWTKFGGTIAGEASDTFVAGTGATEAGSGSVNLTLARKFIDGGMLSLGAGVSLVSDLLGWDGTTVGSLLSANVTQPLLRGGWRGFAYEAQYRLERSFLFAVYEYDRYTQTYAADVLSRYYGVLQRRDQLENQKDNIERLKRTLELTKVLVAGGQRSRVEQDQAEQRVLDSQVRYESDQQAYRDSLDDFKVFVGLPVRASVEVDYPGALDALRKIGPKEVPLDDANAVDVALSARPDVLTQRAAVRDADRDLEIAADAFLPQLDLTLGISAPGTDPRDFARVQFNRNTRSADLKFNYTLDQTDNRDAYRAAAIARQKAGRDLAEFLDRVRLDVRTSHRSLVQVRRTYDLQVRSTQLAQRRMKLAELEQRGGQASARDVLDAQDALNAAQNGLTTALVTYTTTRVRFLAGLGLIAVEPNGQIRERTEPRTFERIVRQYPYVGLAFTDSGGR
jgi:outer membrane protein TolC